MSVVAQFGSTDEGGARQIPLRPGAPLSGLMLGGRPVFLTDLTGLKDLSDVDNMVTRMLFADCDTGLVLPCVWGHATGVVALGGLADDEVVGPLRHEITAATPHHQPVPPHLFQIPPHVKPHLTPSQREPPAVATLQTGVMATVFPAASRASATTRRL